MVPRFAAISILTLALAACGGSSNTTNGPVVAATYVRTVCRDAVQWDEAVAAAFRAADKRPHSDDESSIRADMLAFFDDVRSATDALVERVDKAGFPQVSDGTGVAGRLRSALAETSGRLAAERKRFAAIRVTDVEPAASIEGAMGAFGEQLDAVKVTVQRLVDSAPALRKAGTSEPACLQLAKPESG